nr:teichoic acids export ATP-binding protein TagH [uncultured bacterium]
MSSDVAIRCTGLSKAYQLYARRTDRLKQVMFGGFRRFYQEYWVLRGIDLEIERGECVGIIGANGAGKTTLLQLLSGITQPTSGQLEISGRIAPILALGSGFVGDLSGRDNVLIAGVMLGLRRAEIMSRLPAIQEFSGIGPFIDQPVRVYSTGMRARLAFSICAHADVDIMVVDEALAVGDAVFREKCMRFMESFRRSGTLVVVSHEDEQLAAMCDRLVWIDGGTIRASGETAEMLRQYRDAMHEDNDDGSRFRFESAAHAPLDPAAAPPEGMRLS